MSYTPDYLPDNLLFIIYILEELSMRLGKFWVLYFDSTQGNNHED